MSTIVIETWSDHVEGREVSQPLTKGRSRGFTKASSIMEGRAFPERGIVLYMAEELSSPKPPSTTRSKYGGEEETSWDEKEHSRSARELSMFRSPTTKSRTPVSGKRDSGGTEWTLRSPELLSRR